jgi:drug/metabolite transporter (DMT)-like permease
MTMRAEYGTNTIAGKQTQSPRRLSRIKTAWGSEGMGVALALLAVYIIWGSTYLAIRIAIQPGGMPPFLMAGGRFLVAGILLFGYLKVRGYPTPNRKEWLGAGLVGILLLVTGNGLVVVAEQWVSSGLAALVIATVPIWAALFAGLWGRWPKPIEWVGLGLGFLGIVLLNLEGQMQANPFGALALLVAAGSWAFGSVWSRHLSMPHGLMSSAAQMLVGGAVLLVLSLGTGERMTTMPTTGPLLAFVYLVVFGSLVGFSAYSFLLQRVRPSLATSYAYVNPVVAVALGVGLAGEHVTMIGLAAMPVILAGVAIVVLARNK